jgi:hypothetical protein
MGSYTVKDGEPRLDLKMVAERLGNFENPQETDAMSLTRPDLEGVLAGTDNQVPESRVGRHGASNQFVLERTQFRPQRWHRVKKFDVGGGPPAERLARKVGGTEQTDFVPPVELGMKMRIEKQHRVAPLLKNIEDFEVADAGRDLRRNPAQHAEDRPARKIGGQSRARPNASCFVDDA